MLQIDEKEITRFNETVIKMINYGFKFTVIHNAEDKRLTIISSTKPDKIKHKMPEFNIFLSGKDRIVDMNFYYAE